MGQKVAFDNSYHRLFTRAAPSIDGEVFLPFPVREAVSFLLNTYMPPLDKEHTCLFQADFARKSLSLPVNHYSFLTARI